MSLMELLVLLVVAVAVAKREVLLSFVVVKVQNVHQL